MAVSHNLLSPRFSHIFPHTQVIALFLIWLRKLQLSYENSHNLPNPQFLCITVHIMSSFLLEWEGTFFFRNIYIYIYIYIYIHTHTHKNELQQIINIISRKRLQLLRTLKHVSKVHTTKQFFSTHLCIQDLPLQETRAT